MRTGVFQAGSFYMVNVEQAARLDRVRLRWNHLMELFEPLV